MSDDFTPIYPQLAFSNSDFVPSSAESESDRVIYEKACELSSKEEARRIRREQAYAQRIRDIEALMALMRECPYGGIVSLEAMSATITRDITKERYLVYEAQKRINRENGAVFSAVYKIGYKRLFAGDIAAIGTQTRRMVRRKLHAAKTKLQNAAAKNNSMDAAERMGVMKEVSVLNCLEHLARDTMLSVVKQTSVRKPLTTTEVAAQFFAHLEKKRVKSGAVVEEEDEGFEEE